MTAIADLFDQAVQQHQAGHLAEAQALYEQVLQQHPHHAQTLHMLGVLACQNDNLAAGIDYYQRALAIKPNLADALYNLGLALQISGDLSGAIAHWRRAIAVQPNNPQLHTVLGGLLVELGDLPTGVGHFRQALAIHPKYAPAHLQMAAAMTQLGQWQEVIQSAQRAIQLDPHAFQAYHYLGQALSTSGQLDAAIAPLEQALQLEPNAATYYLLGKVLEEQNQTEAAIAQFQAALQLQPRYPEAYWCQALTLPVIYDSPSQIEHYRQQFQQGLQQVIGAIDVTQADDLAFAFQGIGSRTNFYLAYQGRNDRELQAQYGQFVCQVMAARFPQWATVEPSRGQVPLKIGYLSAHFIAHSAAAWARGWMRHHDRRHFQIYVYHLGQLTDHITAEIQSLCDRFRHCPGTVEQIATQVRADHLDGLIFTDIGMDAQTTQLAGLRLAPVQCTAWGHPVTSGLPTIDYYLSSELMEPDNGQDHYTETLIRLPHIGISYTKPPCSETQLPRSRFSLRSDSVVYLCVQSIYKFLPQYDRIFARIAQRVPQAQFVFLRYPSHAVLQQFQARLQTVFAEVGLDPTEFCVFLPQLPRDLYWQLNRLSDVFLDPLAWSGGNSTLEAVAFGLPVVTRAGEFMRSRHSAAILQRTGVTATIAVNEVEYVDIAVRLGLDPDWRRAISEQMQVGHDRLFDDVDCVQALDQFLLQVV